jgi:hypothetical protein
MSSLAAEACTTATSTREPGDWGTSPAAVGTVAALAVKQGVGTRNVSIQTLQDTLLAQGAEIGETLGDPNLAAIEEVGQLPFEEPPTTGDRDSASSISAAWVSTSAS